jgi:hypothetical protein
MVLVLGESGGGGLGFTCGDGAAWGVDVYVDRFVWVFGLEEEELCDDGGGGLHVYFAVEADDAFFEQS